MSKRIVYWEVFDTTDGRDRSPVGNFANELDARHVADLRSKTYCGVMQHTILIHDAVEDFQLHRSEELKNRAVKKLNPDELDALRDFFQKNPNAQIAR
jgi:hypothetical protein